MSMWWISILKHRLKRAKLLNLPVVELGELNLRLCKVRNHTLKSSDTSRDLPVWKQVKQENDFFTCHLIFKMGLQKPSKAWHSFCVLRECFLTTIFPADEFLVPQRFQVIIAPHKIRNTASTWVCVLGSLWPCGVLVHSCWCVCDFGWCVICLHRVPMSYVLQLLHESSCVHSSSSWKEWKRECSEEGATERKRLESQTHTGMAMTAIWPSFNRFNQLASILWNTGGEIIGTIGRTSSPNIRLQSGRAQTER